MTYNVFGGMLSLTQSITILPFPISSLSLHGLPFHPLPTIPNPFLTLPSLYNGQGVWESAIALQQVWEEPGRQTHFVQFTAQNLQIC